ncbi:MAG: hypothetical protein ACLQLC_13490 [Candidatus Sulfotelmatobacter sp.]
MSLKRKDLYMGKFSKCLLVSLLSLIPAGATAQTLGLDFSVPAQVSNSQTEVPFEWYTDRFAPAGFSAARGVLSESVSPSGFQTPTPSFYNTQGNKFDLLAGTNSVSIELYVPSTWELLDERMAGFWITAFDSTYVVGDYPIIEFQGPIVSEVPGPSYYPNGGVAGFYGWNNMTNEFDYIGLPAGFTYNHYYKLTIALSGGQFLYTVSDTNGNNPVSLGSPFSDPLDSYLGNVILEGYNYDAPLTIQWKLLKYSFTSNGQIVWN